MEKKEREFQRRLLATFTVEAAEHVEALSSGLVALERARTPEERLPLLESVFRGVHSLKGAARAVGQAGIETLCQSTEGVFAALKREGRHFTPALFDVLHEAADALGKLLAAVGREAAGADAPPIAELLRRLDRAAANPARLGAEPGGRSGQRREPPAAPQEEKTGVAETVRIATAKLDSLLRQAEELLSAKANASQRAAEVRELLAAFRAARKEQASAPRKGAQRETGVLASLEARLQGLAKAAEHDQRALFAMVDGLLEDMKNALMLPVSSALGGLPKVARDLARAQGKEVELTMSGGEIEIDRRILEEMRDPLLHLVRNSVDHGIETAEVRRRENKPPQGTVSLVVEQKEGGKVEILVADDGAGIDLGRVREAARRLGMVADDAPAGGDADLLLVFRSGLSTSPMITDLSGRGLGLAIVWEKVQRLGGTISAQTEPRRGTTFRIVLPLTLATFRGVHLRVGDQRFVLPSAHVQRCARVRRASIQSVENRETISWEGQAVALVRLADVLELPRSRRGDGDTVQVAIVGGAGTRVAFGVDEIVGEQEVLLKTLGKQLGRVRNVAGATVLGSGKAVPVLNVADLLLSAARVAAAPVTAPAGQPTSAAPTQAVLVAEDSITSRALLKNILESAGYRVATAVDGAEAFALLKTERFDLVVSDVEMPRMDGFDLTAKIRADAALARLPVVLVTGLESREHRERGVEAGANAYLVKSSFEQGNLLEVVRRLL